ncbi:protein MOTHER of FT and TFL1-like [Juglans microcarpa x Juglans regia]|uniref:protein MOTHER of FT and TFL1-like n=1 Tax=Juglans microcarpa x Juglans regia TaxID=2249226 RepID=UPI001B7EB292|nr:protein MOTHER of FT and TFL1-like [Juglans microcarpa x Juglans regia]
MARSIEPLVVGKVIGDVVDMFTPAANFIVHYGSKQVANGCEIKPSAAADMPSVQILAPRPVSTNLYTLVMVDPDAPSPSEPTMREWLHWIVVDIPEGSDATKGKEFVPYMGPRPPIGIHRYAFVLFKQKSAMMVGCPPPNARANFSARQFAAQYELGLPVAAVYFNSQKEPASRKR